MDMICVTFNYNTAIYAHSQDLCSWERPLNAVKIVLESPLINAPRLIDTP